MSVGRSLFARVRALPRGFLDSCLRLQSRSAGFVSIQGHHFFAPTLDRSSVVIDAGAHTGEFSREIADRFGCLCYALEPVPELLARIPEGLSLRRFALALGGEDGEVMLHLSNNPQANSVHAPIASEFGSRGSLMVRITSLETFLEQNDIQQADLLKLDIEGSELAVFESTSEETLQRIGQITVEFHDFLPSFRDSRLIEAVKKRLRRAGFTCVVFSRPAGDHADTLFINRRRLRLGPGRRLNLLLMRHVTLELRRLLHLAGPILMRRACSSPTSRSC